MKVFHLLYGFVALIFTLVIFSPSVIANPIADPDALAEASPIAAPEGLPKAYFDGSGSYVCSPTTHYCSYVPNG